MNYESTEPKRCAYCKEMEVDTHYVEYGPVMLILCHDCLLTLLPMAVHPSFLFPILKGEPHDHQPQNRT